MTISDIGQKCKKAVLKRLSRREILTLLILLLASSGGFGLGYLAGIEAGKESGLTLSTPPVPVTLETGKVVAAKNGTVYYLAWCAGAERINAENKIWFDTEASAQAAGYSPATNCKGL